MEGEGSFDDVAATELPFCGNEEESQHLFVNNFVGEGDSQRTLALRKLGDPPHGPRWREEYKATLSSSTSALVVMAFLSLWRK